MNRQKHAAQRDGVGRVWPVAYPYASLPRQALPDLDYYSGPPISQLDDLSDWTEYGLSRELLGKRSNPVEPCIRSAEG